tara:strand:+ start:284 stop:1000 length:717 start_codon:yes stop_codon:yes gene_type:complete
MVIVRTRVVHPAPAIGAGRGRFDWSPLSAPPDAPRPNAAHWATTATTNQSIYQLIGILIAVVWVPAWATQRHTQREAAMPTVEKAAHQKGDFFVDYEEKVFEDVKAEAGEKALVTFHTVAFEGSIGLVNMLQATRLLRKGFDTSVLLYGPGVTLGLQRGFPTLGDEAFPGHLAVNNQLTKFMGEGGKVYACRFALQALYGHGEPSLIEGITPINPLDVLDLVLLHRRDNAFILDTWTL